jgi:bifunctional enzyme Fae/Hps
MTDGKDFMIGEALVGEGNEVAHIDLTIGRKTGPVGQAFLNGLTQLSQGHTPLLAVIRPNLTPKPATLIIPKVTVKNLEDAGKIFGPAQAAVAKAVADSLQEGVIPEAYADEYVILCSVFIHPEAQDYDKIYRYNYSATKLAIHRALTNYPDLKKINFEKDRSTHAIAGVKMERLWRPPYLQIALDVTSMDGAKRVLEEVPHNDMVIFEAGTPFIKEFGVRGLKELRKMRPGTFLIADLKTLDVGKVEVDQAYNQAADAVVVSGLASIETVDSVIYEAHRMGIYAFVDMMNVADPKAVLKGLKNGMPDVVILHRNVDAGQGKENQAEDARWKLIKEVKSEISNKILFAVAGGINPKTAKQALINGADILIVGRYITQSKDIERASREFLKLLGEDTDLYRTHWE